MQADQTLKQIAKLSLIYLFILLLLALFFYKERMLFLDAPWIVFHIINTKFFCIQEHRYGSFLTQLFPLIGVKLKLSINSILLLYSASFNLLYLAIGFILLRMKQYKLLILEALYFSLLLSSSFYWTNNELHQGMAWLFLLFGFVFYAETQQFNSVFKYLGFIILAFLSLFTHPLILLVCGFLWVFFLLNSFDKKIENKTLIIYTCLLASLAIIKYYWSKNGWYDGNKIEMILNTNLKSFTKMLQGDALKMIAQKTIDNYWISLLIGLSGIWFLLFSKKYFQLFFILISIFGFTFLIALINYESPNFFYLESELMPVSIFLCIVFVWEMAKQMPVKVLFVGMILLFSVRLGYIIDASTNYTKRISYLAADVNFAITKDAQKLIIIKEKDAMARDYKYTMTWALPVETLMYSAITQKQLTTIAYLDSAELHKMGSLTNEVFVTPFFKIPKDKWDKKYFPFPPGSSYYKVPDWLK